MDDSDFLPPLGPVEAAALRRRQRAKNWAMLAGLSALALLLYLIAFVKFPKI